MEVLRRYNELRDQGIYTGASALAAAYSAQDSVDTVAYAMIALAVLRTHVGQGKIDGDDAQKIAASITRKVVEMVDEDVQPLLALIPVVE